MAWLLFAESSKTIDVTTGKKRKTLSKGAGDFVSEVFPSKNPFV